MNPEAQAAGRRPLRLPKAAELVAEDIRRDIVRGALQPGDFLPTEANLIEQFGVSRPTLREALRVLESESLISLHKGPEVAPASGARSWTRRRATAAT